MTDADSLDCLLPIPGRRAYAAAMRDREGAARLAAIANLPIGWLFEDPRREGDGSGAGGTRRGAADPLTEGRTNPMVQALDDPAMPSIVGHGRQAADPRAASTCSRREGERP